jgi:Glycoside-hydrolase family GH114
MRSSIVLAGALAFTGCAATEGDLLRTLLDGATPAATGTWQIQLQGQLDTSFDVQVYNVDIETPASVIADLHAAGRTVNCYFSAGTVEAFRNDASQFPSSAIGNALPNYPDERWVDVRDATVRSIMQARVSRAAAAGCDGVHSSGLDGFQEPTGLTLTRDDQLAYDRWLADLCHGLGLSIGIVDGDLALRQDLLAVFDWTVGWSCLAASSPCDVTSPFVQAKKPAYLVEIGDASRVGQVCPLAKTLGLSAIIKNQSLDAFRVGCP